MPHAMSARWVTGSGWQILLVWSSVSACSVPSPQSKGQAEVIWQAGKVSQLSLSFDERESSLFFFCTLETILMPLCTLNGPTLKRVQLSCINIWSNTQLWGQRYDEYSIGSFAV